MSSKMSEEITILVLDKFDRSEAYSIMKMIHRMSIKVVTFTILRGLIVLRQLSDSQVQEVISFLKENGPVTCETHQYLRFSLRSDECVVCSDSCTTTTYCNHYLCKRCLNLGNLKSCPICRRVLLIP